MAQKKIDTNTLLIIGAAGLGLYIVFKPIKALFDTFGITQSAASQAIQQQQTSGQKSPFSPLYWRSIRNAKLMQQKLATAKAKGIWDSFDNFGEDYEKILAIFKSLSYKTQVSFLADNFARIYQQDLLQFLKDGKSRWQPWSGLSEKQLGTIIELVNKLK